MNKDNKIQAFEYLLSKLVEWNDNVTTKDNDISVLKALKLLFFVSAVGTTKSSEGTLLDDVFSNFAAMPYGHVESDIYSIIRSGGLKGATVDNSKTTILESFNPALIASEDKIRIDKSIEALKVINPNLITKSAFDLVELSHSWYSWKYYFARAKKNSTLREFIPSEIIKAEEKIYF